MSYPEQSVPPSKRKALAEIRVLAESGGGIWSAPRKLNQEL